MGEVSGRCLRVGVVGCFDRIESNLIQLLWMYIGVSLGFVISYPSLCSLHIYSTAKALQ
jgi:hypothetical protein